MFLFKKFVSPLFFPLSLSLLILILGWITLHFRRRMRLGKGLVLFGILLLIVFSFELSSRLLLVPLEHRYPSLSVENLKMKQEVKWIAVLGGGCNPEPDLPATAQLSDATLARLVEGIRIHKILPGARLIFSGGAVFTPLPEAEVMAKAARTFGIGSGEVVIEPASRDTEEQAVRIRKIAGSERIILVTTASHMPRAMALFRKAGMDPIPAPTQFRTAEGDLQLHPDLFYPRAVPVLNSETAVYEYLGMLWAKLRGKI